MEKISILVDLDVVTTAIWDKKDIKLINRIKKGEFEVYVPYLILDLVSKWKFNDLKDKIKHFYELYATKILTAQNVLSKLEELNINDKKLINEFKKHGVKEEDIVLVIITSIFNLDYLVTCNRKHLKNKEKIINEVLKENGLRTVKIVLPNEI